MSDSVRPHGLQPTRLLRPWDSPVKNTGVGCHFLLQCMKVESESSNASKVMLKILQAKLQQYLNHELPDVQAGFRTDRGTRDQIANIRWIMEKGRVPEKHLFLLY